METLRTVVTWVGTSIFGILAACLVLALTENFKELLKQWGATTFLIHLWDALPKNWRDALRWERLRALWWLWSIFGLSGGVSLALWLTPQILGPTSPTPSRTQAPVITPKPVTRTKTYSQAEKEDLKNATRDIEKMIDSDGSEVATHINNVLRLWSNLDNFPTPSGIAPFLNGIDVLEKTILVFKKSITFDSTKLGQYRSYSLDIDPLL
jgi:hypothetical protein